MTAEDASGRAHLQLLQRPVAGAWLLARPALSEEEWYGTYHQTLNKMHLTARLPHYGQSFALLRVIGKTIRLLLRFFHPDFYSHPIILQRH